MPTSTRGSSQPVVGRTHVSRLYSAYVVDLDGTVVTTTNWLVENHPDRYCPFPGGRGEPDCAAVVAAIEACTGTTVHKILGKPDATIFHSAIRGPGVEPQDCIVVGDRLANNAGAASALVLTGETRHDDLHGDQTVISDRWPVDTNGRRTKRSTSATGGRANDRLSQSKAQLNWAPNQTGRPPTARESHGARSVSDGGRLRHDELSGGHL